MKQPWDPAKLRVAFGDVPEPSDVLLFRTGRCYQVLRVVGKTLHCILLPGLEHAEPDSRVWNWQWAPRKRKATR